MQREHLTQLSYLATPQSKIEVKKKGKAFADEVLSLLFFILIFLVTLAEIFTPYLVYIIAPGFIEDDNKFNLAIEFTRITFPFFFLLVCRHSFQEY